MEKDRILERLRQENDFDDLTAGHQASLYAAQIGRSPLAKFLHLARKGTLSLEELRRQFKIPSAAIRFAEKMRCEEKRLCVSDLGIDER